MIPQCSTWYGFLTRPLLRTSGCLCVVAVLVVDCGSGVFMAGLPEMLGILVGMDQKDSSAARLWTAVVQLLDKVVVVPVVQRQMVGSTVLKTVVLPQLQFFDPGVVQLLDMVVDVPVAVLLQYPILCNEEDIQVTTFAENQVSISRTSVVHTKGFQAFVV